MAILSVLALSSLGLLIGLMTGLSASPVVGSLVATLAALAVAWFGGKEQPGDTKRMNPAWLLAFCVFCMAGIFSGIWLRTHNALSPSLKEQVAAYVEAGFEEKDARSVIVGFQLATAESGKVGAGASVLFSGLAGVDLERLNPRRIKDVEEIITTWELSDEVPWLPALAKKVSAMELDAPSKLNILVGAWTALETMQEEYP